MGKSNSKKMTNREKKYRAEIKKELQKDGLIPLDKPKLNRKKFIQEAKEEWNHRENTYPMHMYLLEAISWMLIHTEKHNNRASLEAIGVAKVLKLAIRLHQFEEELTEKGKKEYKLVDQHKYVKDILEA